MNTFLLDQLKCAYDAKASCRDSSPIQEWKVARWAKFLQCLQREKAKNLLEIGAGTGQAGRYFQDAGLDVVCTDLSAEMVHLCREKGLKAHVMAFTALDFPDGHFDGLFAQNCLLHVPKEEFSGVLKAIRRVVRPQGLLYIGGYGGRDFEGVWEEDQYEPKRFYALYNDEAMRSILKQFFEIVSFDVIPMGGKRFADFQAITLRNSR